MRAQSPRYGWVREKTGLGQISVVTVLSRHDIHGAHTQGDHLILVYLRLSGFSTENVKGCLGCRSH